MIICNDYFTIHFSITSRVSSFNIDQLCYTPLIKALRWSGLIFFADAASFSADRMLPV